jgi:capsular polysaccharide biosynthesis protein
LREVPLERLLKGRDELVFARICEGHGPNPRPRYLAPQYAAPQDFWAGARPDVPPVDVLAFPNVEVRSDFTPYKYRKPIASDRIFPAYVADYAAQNSNAPAAQPETRGVPHTIDDPVFCVTHFNVGVYGHFLMEVLPKVVLAQRMIADGLPAKIAFPVNLPEGIVQAVTAIGSSNLVLYDASRTTLKLRLALLPSNVASAAYDLNRCALDEIRALVERFDKEPSLGRIPGPKLFLMRRGRWSFRRLDNEAALAEVAAQYGFESILPETLPWPDQVRMFSRASHVIGEYSSALHGALFSRPEAKVIALGYIRDNDVQSAIAGATGQALAYLLPRDGQMPVFARERQRVQKFEIAPDDLRRCLDECA